MFCFYLYLIWRISLLIPSKHFLFSKMFWRRLQLNIFFFQDFIAKTFSRRLQDVFKTSSRRVCKTSSSRRVCETSSSRRVCEKSSSRRLQEDVLQLCLKDVSKTSTVRLHQDEYLLGFHLALAFAFDLAFSYRNVFPAVCYLQWENVC